MQKNAIATRLLARYFEAADTVFMDGSTPWEVDEALVAFGFSIGPFEMQDLAGLDVARAAPPVPGRRHIPLLGRMMELGKLGKKTGAGWYRYPGGGGKVDDPVVADLALEEAHFAGLTRTDYSENEIVSRMLLALVVEAAEILQDGLATSAEIDHTAREELGFPVAQGGPLQYADSLGAGQIVGDITRLAAEDPVFWQLSPVFIACAETGTPISDWTDSLRIKS
jgi:3-hydroxyacyl-CoA dehydrogenase